MARKEQKLIFTISKQLDGQMRINMSFFPQLAKSPVEFDALPQERKEMQAMAADLGKYAMQRMAQSRTGKFDAPPSKLQGLMPESVTVDEAGSFDPLLASKPSVKDKSQ